MTGLRQGYFLDHILKAGPGDSRWPSYLASVARCGSSYTFCLLLIHFSSYFIGLAVCVFIYKVWRKPVSRKFAKFYIINFTL
jgi:hypothetical protein